MAGKRQRELTAIALDQRGYVSSADARRAGISPKRLADMVASGQAVRSAHGLYRLDAVPRDELDGYMFAALWPRGLGVISHSSAAVLHSITDANPAQIHVTVPRGFRTTAERPAMLELHREDLPPTTVGRVEGIPVVRPHWCLRQMIDADAPLQIVRGAIDRARRDALISGDQFIELTALANEREHLA